jgi:microcystin-dependent protein
MKKLALLLAALVAVSGQALGATQSQIPLKFPIPFGNSAGGSYIRTIPTPSQIGIQNCAASLTDGFPPLTFVPAGAGGCPPFGQDFNGVINQSTAWARWQAMGGAIPYDSTFSASIGGYPIGAVVPSLSTQNLMWQSTADNNTSNPDAGGANWTGVGYMPTGGMIPFAGSTAPPGYLLCYGQAVSRTTYAALFAVIGVAYGVGDGSTTFNVPDIRGRTVYGPDAMGGTPANRITAAGGGFSAVIGAGGGSQNETLTQAQMAPITPSFAGTTQTWSLNQGVVFPQGVNVQGGSGQIPNTYNNNTATVTVTPSGNINGFSGLLGQSHPILSPGQVASYIIKY